MSVTFAKTALVGLALALMGSARASLITPWAEFPNNITKSSPTVHFISESSLNIVIEYVRQNTNSKAHANMRSTVFNDKVASGHPAIESGLNHLIQNLMDIYSQGSHDHMLKVIGGIDLKIAQGETIPWPTLPSKYWNYYALLVVRMQYLFYSDKCAPYYNTDLGHWTTCCVLEMENPANASFCGTNVGMRLPIPCRSPKSGFDFGKKFKNRSVNGREKPNSENAGDWACEEDMGTTDRNSEVQVQGPISRQQRRQEDTYLLHTVKDSFEITETFVIEIIPVTTPSDNICGSGSYVPRGTCYAVCCDSAYMTSPFCTENASNCY